MKYQQYNIILVLILFFMLFESGIVYGFDPQEIVVVANRRMAGSVDIARYYMDKREIPNNNLVITSLTLNETIARDEFNDDLKNPVLEKIQQLRPNNRIAAIVVVYGVPLKVEPEEPSWEDLDQIRELRVDIQQIESNESVKGDEKKVSIKRLKNLINNLQNKSQRAAVDSELSLLKVENYVLESWIKNPYFVGFQKDKGLLSKNDVLLVSRLDGPDRKTVYQMINDSLKTEEKGLKGVAYFDARWPDPGNKVLAGYKRYDASLHRAAEIVSSRLRVVKNDKSTLFPVNCCPDAALYGGWYSLAKYVDSFKWNRGAIGYHIASAECRTLKDKKQEIWCLKMLQHGAAATIGPVYEPYVQGFPLPEIFFGTLVEGFMTLGEAYLISQPFFSWQTILIGDPLYKPFQPMQNSQ